jgi:hypothetical protein
MNDASIFDGMFSRIWNDGARLDLGAGVNCTGGIVAARNSATRRIDISVDAPRVVRSSYAYAGDVTVAEAGVATAIALNGAATTIPIASIADIGFATTLDIRVAHALRDGQLLIVDDLRVAVYRRADGVLELLDRSTGLDAIGALAELELNTPNALIYTLRGAHSGALSLAISEVPVARNVRAWIWVGESWAVPAQAL